MNPSPEQTTAGTRIEPASTFHIAFCVDNHYFRSMGATITSIIANNPDQHFTFHVFAFSVSDDHQKRLKQLDERFNVTTRIHLVDPEKFEQFAHFIKFSYYSLSIFTRLILPAELKGITDKVLYLDADILCVGRVRELVEMDLRDSIAVVVPDAEETTRRRCAALQLKHPRYFNGGVLYINVDQWLDQQITEQAMQTLLDRTKEMRFNDQDALNIVLDGRATFIDTKWNVLYDLFNDLSAGRQQLRNVGDARFIHFAGAVKPWAQWSRHEARELFAKYHAMSPWSDMALDAEPKNSREMRMYARLLKKWGAFFSSARWYVKYMRARSR